VALIIGWIGVSGSGYPAEQNAYIISGGIGGMFLLGLGGSMWVSADLRDEWRKLDRLEGVVREGIAAGADVREIALPPEAGESEAPSSTRRLRVSAEP
jgi:hypothetical protein